MTLSIVCTDRDTGPWAAALTACDPSLDIQIWPNEACKADVQFAVCWNHPEGVLKAYPNLRCICSMGAGIDHLLRDAALPDHLPVVRLVDPQLSQSMSEYICTAVLYFFREFDRYQQQQKKALWLQQPLRPMARTGVGIMGLGVLGSFAADRLSAMGFNVTGWSRSKKKIPGVTTYAGDIERDAFLARADILVCLLPLTEKTAGILNFELFSRLPKGACLINASRGGNLVEEDLIPALNQGLLRGACLDVFKHEPLPEDHPFWAQDNIIITPHCSSITDPESVAPQIVQNYRNLKAGLPLMNQVDIRRGY